MMKSINPANGQLIKEYQQMDDDEVFSIIEEANEAKKAWREQSFVARGKILKKAATILRDRADELAVLMAKEMGKPLSGGQAEAEKCAWVCEYYAENAQNFLQNEPVDSDASESFIAFEPLGTVFAIMPWNYPFWQLF